MNIYIKDTLQVAVAVLITCSMVASAAPSSVQAPEPDPVKVNEEPKTVVVEKKKPVKKITWRDNPNNCNQKTHYIAKGKPFGCIPKPLSNTKKVKTHSTGHIKSSRSVATPKGSCESWMRSAGVPLTYATRTLIINESGCRPNAVNPKSGACGIPQALPCSKMPCTLQDPVCQLKWMANYVRGRYTTWEKALAFWSCKGTCYNNYGPVYNKKTTWY